MPIQQISQLDRSYMALSQDIQRLSQQIRAKHSNNRLITTAPYDTVPLRKTINHVTLAAEYHFDEGRVSNITASYQGQTYTLTDSGGFDQWMYLLNDEEWRNSTSPITDTYLTGSINVKTRHNALELRFRVNYVMAGANASGFVITNRAFTVLFAAHPGPHRPLSRSPNFTPLQRTFGDITFYAEYHPANGRFENVTASYRGRMYVLEEDDPFRQWGYLLDETQLDYLIGPLRVETSDRGGLIIRFRANYVVATADANGVGIEPTRFTLYFE